ncbi:AB hydrolase superfamily protein YdjP [Echria macrotheca]|uniref:AB hydrolase superfamily protein YdjP n=1 Tax=Echria macrotheca TaxID=438768 RepID=A0AAJ0BKM4_9PEZI|nr:AB hydrolase superfamily protein YdjP [Echria macrotheca]
MKLQFLLTFFVFHLAAAASMKPQSAPVIKTQDGIGLRYNQTGPKNGQQLLFVPGWRQAAVEWRKQVEYFSQVGFRVTTFDMRGHGDSDKPDFGYRVSRFAADLNDVLTQLDLRDVTIIGHSMGSSLSWAWWDQYPDSHRRVAKFVFVDQSAVIVKNPHWTDAQAAEVSAIFGPGPIYDIAADLANQLEPLVRSMFTPSVSEADFEWVLDQNKKMSDANAAALFVDHSFRDWRDVLPRITVPALVLSGELSVFPHAGIAWIATQIPGAKSYTFTAAEKGSHFVFWENPERFNEVVYDFVKR